MERGEAIGGETAQDRDINNCVQNLEKAALTVGGLSVECVCRSGRDSISFPRRDEAHEQTTTRSRSPTTHVQAARQNIRV